MAKRNQIPGKPKVRQKQIASIFGSQKKNWSVELSWRCPTHTIKEKSVRRANAKKAAKMRWIRPNGFIMVV